MASQKTKFTVGLFVAGGLCIAVLAIIWLGMSRYFEKGNFYVTYFDESVQGLSKDSPVKYRGVSVGRVESIKVAPDEKLIEVMMKMESGQTLGQDIVAQLKDVGITGSMFVELDLKVKDEEDRSPPISFPSEYPMVASKPSELSELLRGLDDVLTQIGSLDLAGISDKIKLTLDNISRMIADADVKGISTDIRATFKDASNILDGKRWDAILASVQEASGSLNQLIKKAQSSLGRVDKTFAVVGGIVSDNETAIKDVVDELRQAVENAGALLDKGTLLITRSDESIVQLRRRLLVSAQNLAEATDNLNRLMELLADHPSQLIFGEPPPPREFGSQDAP